MNKIIERWKSKEPYNDSGHLIDDTIAEIERLEQRAAEPEAHLRAVLDVKSSYCPWCHSWQEEGHKPDCPRQAAAKWLEEHVKDA